MIKDVANVNTFHVNEKQRMIVEELLITYGEKCFLFPQSMHGTQSAEECRKKLQELGFIENNDIKNDRQLPPQLYWRSVDSEQTSLPEVSRNVCALTPMIERKNIKEKTTEDVFSMFPREFNVNDSYDLVIRLPTLVEFILLARQFHCLSEDVYTATNTTINDGEKKVVFTGNINAGGTGCYELVPIDQKFPNNAVLYLLVEIVPKNTQTKNEEM